MLTPPAPRSCASRGRRTAAPRPASPPRRAAPGASVRFDRSRVVGGAPPLLRVRAPDARPTFLAAARSTLVCGRTLLHVDRATENDRKPALAWLGWDSLLSRSSDAADGDL